MLADHGFFLLFVCFLLSIYGAVSSIVAAKMQHKRLFRSSKMAATIAGVLCLVASVFLWYMFYDRDYSVGYIFRNSSDDLPAFYTLTAFWSALEGSHLLWTLLLAFFTLIAHWTYSKDNEHIMPYVSASLQLVMAWMYYLTISYSDPFTAQLPAPENGQGMNALLQNFYMAFHPPSLFIGYTTLGIPFAYGMAALAYGDITEGWLRTVRRWSIVSWIFLTIGIFLGGRWAYVELGWAGYWAWDPVENSSFMPWLFCTALLHSLIIQDKIGHLKKTSIVLATLAFFFAFFGTFITRSGVISSVHSFAQSSIGPNYLIFLALLMCGFALLYGLKAQRILPADTQKVWGLSKESALVVTLFLILTFAAIVFIGTVYPIVSEWITGVRFNIQAPYFNAFAPYIGLAFIIAITIGNLMRYNSKKLYGGKKLLIISAIGALPLTILFAWAGDVFRSQGFNFAAQIVGIWLSFWSIICLTGDLYGRAKTLKFKTLMFVKRNMSYTGAYIAHIGLIISVLGFLGNYRGIDKTVTLNAGDNTELYGYNFAFNSVQVGKDKNATLYQAPLQLTRDGKSLGTITPARSKYPTKPELMHEVAVKSTFWHDIYIVLSDFDRATAKRATLEIYINPTVRLVWISCVIMVIGGFMSLFDRYRGNKSRDAFAGNWEIGVGK